MGRLFWKFFLSILLAQVVAAVGIGGAIWLRNRDAAMPRQQDIDTGPRAEDAIESAAATLEFGGVNALQSLLENMNRHRVYAVNEQGRELLGRIVKPAMILEARRLLKQDGSQRVVREVKAADGHRYALFLPSRENLGGMQAGGAPLLRSLASIASVPLDGGHPGYQRGHGDWRGHGPGMGPAPGAAAPVPATSAGPAADSGTSTGTSAGPGSGSGPGYGPGSGAGAGPGQGYGSVAGPGPGQGYGPGPGFGPGTGNGPGPGFGPGPQGPPPRFQPLTPFIPIAAAVLASLLFAALLAWYFSRPIRSLRQAFEAASHGDLAPRFARAGGKRGDELSDLGRDFDRMTARLRSLMDAQTRLLHDVSHELRSPLARLQAAIGLAHQQPDKAHATMERIERESVRMDKLVGELLTLARLETSPINPAHEQISMAELLEEIVADAEFEAASHDRAIELRGSADVAVSGQADLLARAIENIVRNAIKHSPAGGTVRVELETDEATDRLRIRVLDRGPGVAQADLQAIFEPFFRSSDTLKDVEGHGLGLAIAQQVVLAHGGSIAARNREHGGLAVEIALPIAQHDSAA
ncbi:histidine kinase [Massilia sp. Root418]|uniref:sensor histidine kinase n=1 Tax=Massilia sp. Root418 TaxID=1736532 RepID=UPI0006FDE120|nr:ATP-binding protein [Massilia sp. Root418]KQX01819.1 histidine kinase [Massilia sp. Root418]